LMSSITLFSFFVPLVCLLRSMAIALINGISDLIPACPKYSSFSFFADASI
jgi:hypothetical protein